MISVLFNHYFSDLIDISLQEYRDAPQVKVDMLCLATDADMETIQLSDLVPCAPIDVEKAVTKMEEMLTSLSDSIYSSIAFYAYMEFSDKLEVCPAAKSIHHAFVGGLTMHTYHMMCLAELVYLQYKDLIPIDHDLLIAGTFLHDIGKIREFELTDQHLVKDYSKDGQLFGHPTLGVKMVDEIIDKYCPDADPDKVKLLKHIKENAPSIVFLDDLDKFSNCDIDLPDAEEYVTVQSCIDDLTGCEVFVLATANNKRKLPRSLLRAGRFDRVMEIAAPHGADAERIIRHYLTGKNIVGDLDVKLIARIMDGRSCAELETVINAAAVYAGYERADHITEKHFIEACLQTIFAVSAKSDDDDELDLHLDFSPPHKKRKSQSVTCHEAGHAVIAEVLCPGSVTLTTIRGDNNHFGGFTLFRKDDTVDDFTWMECQIISTLGGKAALEQKYGVLDLGSSADLQSAFDTVKELVRSCCLCGFHLRGTGYQNSQAALAHQEQAVAAEIEKYYRKAKELLAANHDFFEKVEQELIEKKLLTMRDLARIRKECDGIPTAG